MTRLEVKEEIQRLESELRALARRELEEHKIHRDVMNEIRASREALEARLKAYVGLKNDGRFLSKEDFVARYKFKNLEKGGD
jgi:hypothetical protein